jgi:RNA polymerase sigma-32 factor
MQPEHVATIARNLGVTEQDVVDMNRRLSRDASLRLSVRLMVRANGRIG